MMQMVRDLFTGFIAGVVAFVFALLILAALLLGAEVLFSIWSAGPSPIPFSPEVSACP